MSPDDESEDQVYSPESVGLGDGDIVIFDPVEFEVAFNCFGVQLRDNQLFVLCKESKRWVPAEGRGQEPNKPEGRLTRVK